MRIEPEPPKPVDSPKVDKPSRKRSRSRRRRVGTLTRGLNLSKEVSQALEEIMAKKEQETEGGGDDSWELSLDEVLEKYSVETNTSEARTEVLTGDQVAALRDILTDEERAASGRLKKGGG